ncbi:hypothetical protein [Kibdelosporangium aridum]|uniref:hypothetical protein n=1 Tax=Kibdelosporangium aridum TaxID=2030 RepID=UPI000A01433B|nr:hypothetical protein [Kibdelosporangium aridum]
MGWKTNGQRRHDSGKDAGTHADVIGASDAGLLVAIALSDVFPDQVGPVVAADTAAGVAFLGASTGWTGLGAC